jgi:hypothetical protein
MIKKTTRSLQLGATTLRLLGTELARVSGGGIKDPKTSPSYCMRCSDLCTGTTYLC